MIQPAQLYHCDLSGLTNRQNREQVGTVLSEQNVCMPWLDCYCLKCQQEREERDQKKKEE